MKQRCSLAVLRLFKTSCLWSGRLNNAKENVASPKSDKSEFVLRSGSFEPPVWDPMYIFKAENTCTRRPVRRADTYLEDPPQFAHDLYHLHVINAGPSERGELHQRQGRHHTSGIWLGGSWERYTIVPSDAFFFLNLIFINKCMIKTCTEAPRQLFEAGRHSCIHVFLQPLAR